MRDTIVVFHKQLGDLVLLEPALARLAAGGASVRLWTRPDFEPLIGLMEAGCEPFRWTFSRSANLTAYDTGSRSAWRSLAARSVHKRLLALGPGYVKKSHRWIFDRIDVQLLQDRYRARYYWDCTPGSPGDVFRRPRLKMPPASWRPAELETGGQVLIHATAAWLQKCWRAEHWAVVVRELVRDRKRQVVLSGGTSPWERAHVEDIVAQAGVPVLNLAGRTSLQGYLALVAQSELVLAIDSSASHLARAFGRPCLTLFGPTDSRHWHEEGPAQMALQARDETGRGGPLDRMAPETVIRALQDLMKNEAYTPS